MALNSGAPAKLDFGAWPTRVTGTGGARAGLRLAAPADMRGPGKYAVLAHRRRQAQMRARHLLDAAERAMGVGAMAVRAGEVR